MKSTTPSLPLRRLGRIVGGGTPTSDETNWGGAIPFVTPPDLRPVVGRMVAVTARTLTAAGAASGSSLVPPNSILLSIRAPIGYVARTSTESSFNQGCRALVPRDDVDAIYLTYALIAAGPKLEAMGRGTTFTELSTGQMAEFEVPVPSLEVQRVIADYLDHETAQIDELIAEQRRLIDMLAERRTSVIDSVVTSGLDTSVVTRDSGVEWIGSIPAHWGTRPLWSMFRRIKDVDHPDEQMLSVFRDYGVVAKDSRENINQTAENRSIYQLVHPGWLVTNRMKAWQGSVGISSLRGIVSGHYICFEPRHDESHDYLNWLFRSPRYAVGYGLISRGVRIGQAEIDNDSYRVLPVVVPPLGEQTAIAAYLRNQTSTIDSLVEEAEALITLARERRTALITAAVTGQIDVRRVA